MVQPLRPLIVSIHVPKTGGTSFQRTLEDHFGDRFQRDDVDRPANTRAIRRRVNALVRAPIVARKSFDQIDCVHGHFLAAKWLWLARKRPVRFVIWLRDPVERLASHYHFWRRSYSPDTALVLHRRVVEEQWSFERFAMSVEMRDLASEFLWRLPRHQLEFVGLTETYEADHAVFCRRILGIEHRATIVNANPDAEVIEPYVDDLALRMRIATFHARDSDLYEWARQNRPSLD